MNQIKSMELFEEYAFKMMEKHYIPGVGIGINKEGKRLYEQDFGFRDVEKKLPVNADTVFGIASMTKSFTCVAIMQLQELGKLSVHDKVIKYLPDFRTADLEKTKEITIHHLMTHTAGLPPISTHVYARKRSIDQDPSAKDYGLDLVNHPGAAIDTYEEMLDFIAGLDFKLLGDPGTAYSYSNDSFGLLGIIVSRVSGQAYEEYVTEHILQPANMQNSFFDITNIDTLDNITTLYAAKHSTDGVEVYAAPLWWDAPSMRAVGYLKSSVNDILKFLEIFRNNGVVGEERILTSESVDQMIYPHVEFEKGRFYGYGLRIIPDYFGTTFINHGGGLKGVSSFMGVIPEKGLSGVILSNLSDVPTDKLLMGAINVLEDREASATHLHFESYHMPEEDFIPFVGIYKSGEGMKVVVKVVNNQLAIISGVTISPLRCIGENLFIVNEEDRIQFLPDQTGVIDRIFYASRQILKVVE